MKTERELVSAAQNGDREAFDALLAPRRNKALALAVRYSSRDLGEDMLQEAALRAWKALPKFRMESSFETWFTRILIRCCLQGLQKMNRGGGAVPDTNCDHLSTIDPNQHVALIIAERRQAIEEAMKRLSPKQKMIIVAETDDLSIEETATMLGISSGTVKTHRFRAYSHLRRWLANL